MQEFLSEGQLSCKVGMEMASNETIKQAVMAGMALAFISTAAAFKEFVLAHGREFLREQSAAS